MLDIDNVEKVVRHPVVAGFVGSIFAAFSKMTPGASFLERVLHLFMGFACAIYLSPHIANSFSIATVSGASAISFSTGLFGVLCVYVVTEQVKQIPWVRVWESIFSWIPKRGGGA